MNKPTVPFHFRPNKSIDRSIFLDLLRKIDKFPNIQLDTYSYVGLGGVFLEDFRIIHSQIGLNEMFSIENDSDRSKRQKMNKPFKCITCINSSVGDFLDDYDNFVKNHSICWLDFNLPSERGIQIKEFQVLLDKLIKNDIAKITLNANPSSLYPKFKDFDDEELREKRLEELEDQLGDFLPAKRSSHDVTLTKFPEILHKAVVIAANKILVQRKLIFEPLTAITYQDVGHQMLTVTGIMLEKRSVNSFYDKTKIGKWELSLKSSGGNLTRISIPTLSTLEKTKIDRRLPSENKDAIWRKMKFIFDGEEEFDSYIRFYKAYPNFAKIVV